jgi:uncharacterized protein (TIGR03437 family)
MGLGRAWGAALILQVAACAQSGIITTLAGRTAVNGAPARGYDGDNRPATEASLALANFSNQPCDPNRFEQTSHIAVDAQGNIYLTDSNNQRVRRIDPAGAITTVAGSGEPQPGCQAASSVGDNGPALSARLFGPADVAIDRDGSLIVADQQNNRIRRLSTTGTITSIVGNGLHFPYVPNVQGTASPMDWPSALAVDSGGALYFAELHTNRIGRLANGTLSTVAGTGSPAELNKPAGIAIDRTGALLIADTGNHRIRRFANGSLTTIAGKGTAGYCGDGGPAADACLNTPMDVKADALGNIFIADAGNHRVRRIDTAGVMATVAGTGDPGRGADGVGATASALNFPCAVALDANNDLYIVDWQNYLIRKVSFGGAPAISSGGVVNAASFTATVAPGSLVSLFGSNFATETADAGFATEFRGVRVEVNGRVAPLSVISPGQINAQVPYETEPGAATAVVIAPGGRTAPAQFTVTATAVGAFAYPGSDRAIAVNEDGSLNAPSSPAARGSVLVFYVTGLGAVSPAVATGAPAPLNALLFAVTPPSVTIGGAQAALQFAGLTPSFIGLGQINVIVPADAAAGDAAPAVFQAAGQSSKTATVSIR